IWAVAIFIADLCSGTPHLCSELDAQLQFFMGACRGGDAAGGVEAGNAAVNTAILLVASFVSEVKRRPFRGQMRTVFAVRAAIVADGLAQWPAEVFGSLVLARVSIFRLGVCKIVVGVLIAELVDQVLAFRQESAAVERQLP